MGRNWCFNVRPRYTPGSPALVHLDIAYKVAAEEKEFYQHALSGTRGERERLRAITLGLKACAERTEEKAGFWLVSDLITGEIYERPFTGRKRLAKPFGFTALHTPTGLFAVGRCEAQKRGCVLVPEEGVFDTFELAQKAAERLNERYGLEQTPTYLLVRDAMSRAKLRPNGLPL